MNEHPSQKILEVTNLVLLAIIINPLKSKNAFTADQLQHETEHPDVFFF